MKRIFVILAAAIMLMQGQAQSLEPSERLTVLEKSSQCTAFEFLYPSVNNAGEPIVLSSALFAWTPSDRQQGDSIESIHIYSHATIGSNDERPTTKSFSKEQMMVELLPNRTYRDLLEGTSADFVGRSVIIAPDYEGYGATSHLRHPYLSQRLTAQQVVDALEYGLRLYRQQAAEKTVDNPLLPIKSDWRMFALGYSQGAAVSLAVQRHIEEEGLSEKYHFQGSICGDGPYDLTATMRYYFDDDGTSYDAVTDHRRGIITYPAVVPLIVRGMCDTYPDLAPYTIGDLLSQQLLDTGVLGWIDSKLYTTADIGRMWHSQVETGVDTLDRHYSPEQMAEMFIQVDDKVSGRLDKMFTPALFAYMNDASHFSTVPAEAANAQQALHRALAENSVTTGWEPQHRIQFFHSRGDMVVPFGNYLAFRDAHPDGEGSLYRLDDTFSSDDHAPAATFFFLSACTLGSLATHFQWICEGAPTAVDAVRTLPVTLSFSDDWYTLDGRKLNGRPTQKGVYINKGRKILLK